MASLLNSIKGRFKNLTLIGNSVQGENPAPDNPQEIKSAGRKSKNLFDITKYDKYDDTWTNTTYTTKKLKLKPNTTYTISCKRLVDKPKQYVFFNITEGIATGRGIYIQIKPDLALNYFISKGTFTTNDVGEITLSYYVDCPKEQYWFTEVIGDIQIEEGSKETVYEPYSDKRLFVVKVTGKNIFNKNAVKQGYEFGSTANDIETVKQGWFVSDFMPVKATTYLISGKKTGYGCKLYNKDKVFVKNIQAQFGQIKFEEGIAYFRINGEIKDLDKVQVEEGNVVTPYETYTEQSVQIAIAEPLRGIGEYKDTITKDGVARKIYEQTLKKERISMNEYNWDRKFFRLYVNSDKKIDSSTTNTGLFSNMFKRFDIYKGNPTIYWLISEEEIRSMGITEADSREVAYEKIKDFVTNNDIVVQYPIVETTLEPLSEFIQAQLSALHSENGVTHVFVDSGEVEAGISVTYKQKK